MDGFSEMDIEGWTLTDEVCLMLVCLERQLALSYFISIRKLWQLKFCHLINLNHFPAS